MNMEALGLWRSLLFVDAGRIQINKYVFTRDPNLFNLYSAGLGLDITWKGWDLSGRYAHRLGAPPPPNIVSLIDNDQIWMQVSKRF